MSCASLAGCRRDIGPYELTCNRLGLGQLNRAALDYIRGVNLIAGHAHGGRTMAVGTHSGTFTTPAGEIPATGKTVANNATDIFQFRSGKIIPQRTYFDFLGVMTQLGVMPRPAPVGVEPSLSRSARILEEYPPLRFRRNAGLFTTSLHEQHPHRALANARSTPRSQPRWPRPISSSVTGGPCAP